MDSYMSYTVASGIASYHVERDRDGKDKHRDSTRYTSLELAEDFFAESGWFLLKSDSLQWSCLFDIRAWMPRSFTTTSYYPNMRLGAFKNAFGITVDEFYESFEEYRERMWLPTRFIRITGRGSSVLREQSR